ncbi:MAG: response regulator with CheY-like receiver, AAA-type ATPase, and DNA-binding domain [Crocinitomicaceae bacterium]|jgi:serine phosphatase RsbU (regulator of sigma subunit)|nr:response regulator with CheY-like receiver, AAA-type ATPase, and DNA-binding domain [Crocinitomicaceae bacterium]
MRSRDLTKGRSAVNPSSRILVTVFTGLIILCSYFIISTYFINIREAEKRELDKLFAIANTLAFQIDGDEHTYLVEKYTKPGQLKSSTADSIYHKWWKLLYKAQRVNHLGTEITTLSYDPESRKFSYILNSLDKPYIADPYIDYAREFVDYYETGYKIPAYKDEFGQWLTAISPIRNKAGKVTGIVEVDEKFDHFIAIERKKLAGNLAVSLVIFALVAFITLRLVKQISRKEEEQKRIIRESNEIISQKNRDILDSINYAKRIQNAILVPKEEIFSELDAFILYKPKDIVSGDFYYFSHVGEHIILAAVDCTGHGVPGALMSMIGNDLLNHITKDRKASKPAEILDLLHFGVTNVLKQHENYGETRDGMDIALLSIDKKNRKLQYAGAYRPLTLVRNGELITYKADKYPIGNAQQDRDHFTNNEIPVEKGDVLYLSSDGYADQFGGDKGKKFMVKNFNELILANAHLPMAEQEKILDKTITGWMGSEHEQVDDMLVIGLRIT